MNILKRVLLGAIVIILFVIAYRYHRGRIDDINDNIEVKIITIDNISMDQHGNPCFEFSYFYNNKNYSESRCEASVRYRKCADLLLGKKIPVAFSSKDPSNCDVLISPYDYEIHNLIMPDSAKILYEQLR